MTTGPRACLQTDCIVCSAPLSPRLERRECALAAASSAAATVAQIGSDCDGRRRRYALQELRVRYGLQEDRRLLATTARGHSVRGVWDRRAGSAAITTAISIDLISRETTGKIARRSGESKPSFS